MKFTESPSQARLHEGDSRPLVTGMPGPAERDALFHVTMPLAWRGADRWFLDIEEAARFVSLSVSTLQNLVRDGKFPPPRQLAPRRVAWSLYELIAWCQSRPVSMLPPPPNTGRTRR
jgi:prophage regulatory protein